jgi:hypothetical protein
MATIEKVFPENICLDGGTQPRAKIDQAVCDDYGERMKAGVKFPAIDVFFDGENYWLADGFHRLQAYVMAVPGEAIECNLYKGSLLDAQWHSYSVNQSHGLRRTNEDKERAVKLALAHPKSQEMSDSAIAEHVGVRRETILKYRHKAESDLLKTNKSTHRTGRDGRTIKTSNIGKKPASKGNCKAGENGNCTSSDATVPVLEHGAPNPMISLNLSPTNPSVAAATILKLFDTNYVRSLISELTQRLKGISQ